MYWVGKLFLLPSTLLDYTSGKWAALNASMRLSEEATPLRLSMSATARLKQEWAKSGAGRPAAEHQDRGQDNRSETSSKAERWTPAEQAIIQQIREETTLHNRNNVTRTEAYRAVYFRLPELHWSLLAHMVSRNGGWNMTDLKGEWLPRLLGESQRNAIFQFLEQANAAIFHDAFPQLKLYEWSLREGRSLFHLLPAFDVSAFMTPVWRLFWRERDPVPLTVALIVNEQHYIEQRVVRQPFMLEHVLHTWFFGLQSLLQLNGVVFPYACRSELRFAEGSDDPRLAGLVLERFENIDERIEFGKRLYAILFGIPSIRNGVKHFASAVPHTGSRADYAPKLFTRHLARRKEPFYRERLHGNRLKKGEPPIYSPELQEAWPDHSPQRLEPKDWFWTCPGVDRFFEGLPMPKLFEMTEEHARMLGKIELAVLAEQEKG